MESYQLCPECQRKVIEYRILMRLYKAKKIEKKPEKYKLCITCTSYVDMENFFSIHRYKNQDGYNTGSYTNCIVPCGYGMFAPRFYKEQVIDKRRR